MFKPSILLTAFTTQPTSPTASNKLLSSTIGAGIQNILNDALSLVMILGPIVCGIYAVINIMKSGYADDAESLASKKKAKLAVVCAVLCLLVPSILKLIASYFGLTVEV